VDGHHLPDDLALTPTPADAPPTVKYR
jgi:hypothetical protein